MWATWGNIGKRNISTARYAANRNVSSAVEIRADNSAANRVRGEVYRLNRGAVQARTLIRDLQRHRSSGVRQDQHRCESCETQLREFEIRLRKLELRVELINTKAHARICPRFSTDRGNLTFPRAAVVHARRCTLYSEQYL